MGRNNKSTNNQRVRAPLDAHLRLYDPPLAAWIIDHQHRHRRTINAELIVLLECAMEHLTKCQVGAK